MSDECHLCLLGLIALSSLLTGSSGVNDALVFISSGENVRLTYNNALHDCKSTTWIYNNRFRYSRKDTERLERMSLGSDCSLNINNISKEDYGSYTCQQWIGENRQKPRPDARVYLHVLHVSSSQTEINAGHSVTLFCQLYSYAGVSCDDWIHSEGIELFWVNQAGISAPGHCISSLTTTILNEDHNREWRCNVTHRDQVKSSVTYTVKSSGEKTSSSISFRASSCQ
uniref:Ig-like domain-containing protein n=1 Tax=Sinocyclocheilus anshuiensis TaxID=1608454 RepID=A0A671KEG5_9TELE